jgi:DNA-3-methyladenine glycosylase I
MPEKAKQPKRCAWAQTNALLTEYHDKEWGVPVHDDARLFEMLNLEGAQAGLSWLTILQKRENYRKAFDRFDAVKIAQYTAAKKAALLQDPGIVRNRLKVEAVVTNARAFLEVQRQFGSFDAYLWQFTGGKTARKTQGRAVGQQLSKELKKRGFKFVGGEICYAFMQAIGMVDDHSPGCFRGMARRK